MVLSDITMINVRSPVYVATSTDAPYSDGSTKVGRIIFDNLTVINCGRTPFYISAPANNTAKSIILRNVRMSFVGGVEQEEQSNGQGFSPYGMLQAYGIYCRSVDNLELHDVRVDYNGKDQRPALYGENIGTLELDRFAAKRAADSPPMLMFAGIGKLIMNGAEVKPVKLLPTALDAQSGGAIAGEPFLCPRPSKTPARKALVNSSCSLEPIRSSVASGWARTKRRAFTSSTCAPERPALFRCNSENWPRT